MPGRAVGPKPAARSRCPPTGRFSGLTFERIALDQIEMHESTDDCRPSSAKKRRHLLRSARKTLL